METAVVSRQSQFGLILRCVFWCVPGMLVAEWFVRLLVPFPIFYSTWFESGIHQPDPQFGFVYKPGYQGAMRHRDRTWIVPLELDENGLRPPISTETETRQLAQDVVLLGGVSQVFGYGLPNDQTLAANIATASTTPVTVHTLAQPGWNLQRDFEKYKRFYAGRLSPRVVVISLYRPEDYHDLQAPSAPASSGPHPELFWQTRQQVVLPPRGSLSQLAGHAYFRSYLLAGSCRIGDDCEKFGEKLQARWTRLPRHRNKPASKQNQSAAEENAVGQQLLTELFEYFTQQGAKVIVVALPRKNGRIEPPEQLPVPLLDLTAFLSKAEPTHWKAAGHYSDEATRILGGEIARALQPLLRESPPLAAHPSRTAVTHWNTAVVTAETHRRSAPEQNGSRESWNPGSLSDLRQQSKLIER